MRACLYKVQLFIFEKFYVYFPGPIPMITVMTMTTGNGIAIPVNGISYWPSPGPFPKMAFHFHKWQPLKELATHFRK